MIVSQKAKDKTIIIQQSTCVIYSRGNIDPIDSVNLYRQENTKNRIANIRYCRKSI